MKGISADVAELREQFGRPAIVDVPVTALSEWSKDELKAECELRGLPVSGSKAKLLERLEG